MTDFVYISSVTNVTNLPNGNVMAEELPILILPLLIWYDHSVICQH